MNDKEDNNDKIIHFPELEKRKTLSKNKKKIAKQDVQHEKAKQNARDVIEDKYRTQYRAERAKMQCQKAQYNASGKKPFINWQKIPMFTRMSVATLIIIHFTLSFILSSADRIFILYHFGFVPAIYSGGAEWHWSAIFAPLTTLVLHSSWMHLTFNVVMMIAMGVFVERQFGAKRTAIFFLACGMAGNLVYFILSPGSINPVVGASGAISGLFAVTFLVMIEHGMVATEVQKRGPAPIIIIFSAIIIGMGLISHDTAWQSHIGGFWGGLGLFYLWKKGMIRL